MTKPAPGRTSNYKKAAVSSRRNKKTKLSTVINNIWRGKHKPIIIVCFMLIFGGLGAYLLQRSHASPTSEYYFDHGCATFPTLRPGNTGSCVWKLQTVLRYRWGHQLDINGSFDANTKFQVQCFQSQQGITQDGIVGSITWSRITAGVHWTSGADGIGYSTNGRAIPKTGSTCGWYKAPASTGTSNTTDPTSNGNLPLSSLTYVSLCKSHIMSKPYLRSDAAAALFRLNTAYKAAHGGQNLVIDDCYRDMAGQNYAWNCYIYQNCNNGNLAAKPGTSNHGLGIAIDFHSASTDYTWLKAHTSYGWKCCTVSGEAWHYKYVP